MERWTGRIALVTGASAGMGAVFSKRLLSSGMIVFGCSNEDTKLQETAKSLSNEKGKFIPIVCDLRKEDDIMAMFARINNEYGGVDVCINNAGVATQPSQLLTGSMAAWRETFDVNVLALMICTRESVQSMIRRHVDDGHIFFMCSLSGHIVCPLNELHTYAASKHAVRAIAEGVRNELRGIKSHIRTTNISPASVQTDFQRNNIGEEFAQADIGMLNKCLQPDDIADCLIHALASPPHVQVHDILIRSVEQVG